MYFHPNARVRFSFLVLIRPVYSYTYRSLHTSTSSSKPARILDGTPISPTVVSVKYAYSISPCEPILSPIPRRIRSLIHIPGCDNVEMINFERGWEGEGDLIRVISKMRLSRNFLVTIWLSQGHLRWIWRNRAAPYNLSTILKKSN
jgi:hypothetical protein